MEDFSKRALFDFLAMIVDKGLVNPNTGNGWKGAAGKVLKHLSDSDDVRSVDVTQAVLMYNNRNRNTLAPTSMKQYEIRVAQAIENFVKWSGDKMAYRGPSRQGGSRGEKGAPKPRNGGTGKPVSSQNVGSTPPMIEHPHVITASELRLTVPFPLRPAFMAQLVIPRDMTKEEAKRLCAFVDALGHDAPAG